MNENDRTDAETGALPDEKQTDARTPRAIRFSDAEWEQVKMTAAERGIPAAEFVRNAALSLASDKAGVDSASMLAGTTALIERIYRGVYLLSTLKRDEMIRQGRQGEIDRTMKNARDSQDSILNDVSL